MAGRLGRDIFDFFGLPRELRDQTYHEILLREPSVPLHQVGSSTPRDCPQLLVTHTMSARLALISRQFRIESMDRAEKEDLFVLKDSILWCNRVCSFHMPVTKPAISTIEMHLAINAAHKNGENQSSVIEKIQRNFSFHAVWAKEFLRAHNGIDKVNLELYLPAQEHEQVAVMAVFAHQDILLTAMPGLIDIVVHQCAPHESIWKVPESSAVIARRSAETGRLERVVTSEDGGNEPIT